MKPKRTSSLTPSADNYINIIQNHARVLAGRVSFGSGTNGDSTQNMDGYWAVNVVTPGTPDTEFSVTYSLYKGRTAIGFDVKRNNTSGAVYDSGTPWSPSTIFLKCSVASATVTLFVH